MSNARQDAALKREAEKRKKSATSSDQAARMREAKDFKRSKYDSTDQPSASSAASPEGSPTKALQAEEIKRLRTELANETSRADNEKARANDEKARADALQKQVTSLKNTKAAEEPRKPFSELSDRRQRDVVNEMRNELEGSDYSITQNAEIPKVDKHKSFSLYHMEGLTKQQYKEITKVPMLSSFDSIDKFGKELLKNVGYFDWRPMKYLKDKEEILIQVYIANDIKKLVTCYVQHLFDTEWNKVFPQTSIRIVFCADKGGSSTKLGFYIPTEVDKPLSPKRFVVLAAWEGSEDYEAIEPAAAEIFQFIANLEQDGLSVTSRFGTPLNANITPIFTGDFKILSTVLGHQGSASRHFCIKCNVEKKAHDLNRTKGIARDFNSMYNEGRIVESIKRKPLLRGFTPNSIGSPSLHILTGLATKLVETAYTKNFADTDKIIKNAKITFEHGRRTLNGNNMSKLLDYLSEGNHKIPYLSVFKSLHEVKKFSIAGELSEGDIDDLETAINKFSANYRKHPQSELSRINKLHELESHTLDFVKEHGSWGLYSEQSLEGVHKYSNKADRQSFGANQDNNVPLFMKRQLFCAFSIKY